MTALARRLALRLTTLLSTLPVALLACAACQPEVPVVGPVLKPLHADSSADAPIADQDTAPPSADASFAWPADDTPPAIAITTPKDGAQVDAPTVQVSGQVTDDTGVAALSIKVGFNVAAPVTTKPDGSFSVHVALVPGQQEIAVTAHDIAGNATTVKRTVTRPITKTDSAPPQLTVTKPAQGFSVFGDKIRVEGTASDDVGLAEVRVKIGQGGLQLAQTDDGFAHFWLDLSVEGSGAQTIVVLARDLSGKSTSKTITGASEKVSDGTPPTVTITSPANNFATAAPSIVVTGAASDGSGVTNVDLRVGKGPYQPVTDVTKPGNPAFSQWQSPAKLLPGDNVIKVRARDANGLLASASITVQDTSGSQWSAPKTIVLKWQPPAKPELALSLDRKGLQELFSADKAAQVVMMKLDVLPLVQATFAKIRNACGSGWSKPNNLINSCPKAWGQPERNLWRLVTMTPANANVAGTSIASMASIAKGLSQYGLLDSFDKILAAALGIGRYDLIVGEKAVAEAMIHNLIATHPAALPDGRMPITLHDALTDLKSLGSKFAKSGEHPGLFDASAPPHAVIMTQAFKMNMTAVSNLAWHDGVRLSGSAPIKSYVALVQDEVGPTFDDVLEFDFVTPGKFSIDGLAAKPTTDMTMQVFEDPGWAKTGSTIAPMPKGSGAAWKVKPWLLERVLVDASYRQYKNLRRGCDYCGSAKSGALLYESLLGLDVTEIVVGRQGYRKGGSGSPEHFKAISPNPAGWMRIWTLFGLGSPPAPQYVWDMITEVSQRRLLDGGVAQGKGNVRFSLKAIPVGITAADIKAAVVPQLLAQKSKLSALLMGNENKNEALDFWLHKGKDKELWLLFAAPSDPLPKDSKNHAKPGFFADSGLAKKLSNKADGGSGDTIHEKLAVSDAPQTFYAQNAAGVVHQVRVEQTVGDEVTLVVRRGKGP